MEFANLATALPKFVHDVVQNEFDRPLTVNDLRLGIRSVRLTEISDWSNHELDIMEVHAAQFDGTAPLECALDLSAVVDQSPYATSVSSICSPSPFAWM